MRLVLARCHSPVFDATDQLKLIQNAVSFTRPDCITFRLVWQAYIIFVKRKNWGSSQAFSVCKYNASISAERTCYMMYATKIKMKRGCHFSQNLVEIDEIYIEGCTNPGYFKKAVIHDYVKDNPGSIKVNIWPYPNVTHAISTRREKYVKSAPNQFGHDNLLMLPRE